VSRTIRSAYGNRGQGSSLEFWLAYVVDFLAEDECDHRRSGITIRICTEFFEDNKQCSIPQLQYTLAATISGLYEVIGDPREAMKWAYRSFIYAKEDEDDDSIADAECLLQGLLANRTRVEKGDTEEYQQQRFEEGKKTTLEILYHEAESSGHLKEQFSYAQNLMHFQYKTELKSNNNPTGEPWLSRARQVLQRMSADNISSQQELLLDFTLAHAKFDFGDFKGAIEGFDSIIGGCITVQEPLKAHTLFSRGRAYLEEYRATNDTNLWKLSESSLLEASETSGRLGNMDEVACCESVLAYLWYARSREDTGAMITALEHVTKADKLWSKEVKNNGGLPGLPGLMSRYLIQSRSRLEPYDIPGLAFKICFRISAFEEAWVWAERLKARAFGNSLRSAGITTNVNQIDIPTHPCPDEMQINDVDRNSIFVHWVTSGDIVYLLTRRHGQNAFMFLLDIKLSTVSDWYSSLCDSKDDLSDPDDAEETLAELVELCRPLSLSEVSSPGELLVLCPTRILFKIPLHALPVDGVPLIERNPVVYAYASPLLQRQSYTADITNPEKQVNSFGNPTGNTPGGESAAKLIQQTLGGEVFTNVAARKETYMNLCTESRVLHYHGHILVASHELSNAMIFHDEELTAREVFGMDLKNYSPLVCLIGCGSGVERIDVGDEPLGFISGYLYAGASAVIATLWPINDILSGEAFSRAFYSSFLRESRNSGGQVNLAGLLQEAVREIRVKPETRAPYFWAPFVLHGAWNFCLCT